MKELNKTKRIIKKINIKNKVKKLKLSNKRYNKKNKN